MLARPAALSFRFGLAGTVGLRGWFSFRLRPARLGTSGHPRLGFGTVFALGLRRRGSGSEWSGLLTFEFGPPCLLCHSHLRLGRWC